MQSAVLIVDDEQSLRTTFKAFLTNAGYHVSTAVDYGSASQALEGSDFDLVFVDIILGGKSGIDLLRQIRHKGLRSPVIMITGEPNLDTATEAVRLGAFDYLSKPVEKELLLKTAGQALRHKRLADEKARVEAENDRYRKHLEAVFNSVEEGIITVDSDLKVIEANDVTGRFLPLNSARLIGEPLALILEKPYHACCKILQDTLKSGESVREFRVVWNSPTRSRQVVMLNSSPLKAASGRHHGAVLTLRDITALTKLTQELKDRHKFHRIIGKNPQMRKIYDLLEKLSDSMTTVLIVGESGTGKELVADAIHYNSPNSAKPLVKVDCAALSENLLESELFGHIKGAFTGAVQDKIGRFEMADGGTILLDEIGEINPQIQLKLLRVLQGRTFERVGDSNPRKVDLRVIAATNCDLRQKVSQGEFRQDLYYRLKVVEILLPPLRDRRDDIPLLVDHFLKKFNASFQKVIEGLSEDVLRLFMHYAWPGNVRELEHAMEHAFVLCNGPIIGCEHLPDDICALRPADSKPVAANTACSPQQIVDALRQSAGNKAQAARMLGINRRTIYRKIKRHDLEVPQK